MNIHDVVKFLSTELNANESEIRRRLETDTVQLISTCIGIFTNEGELHNAGSTEYDAARCNTAEQALFVLSDIHQAQAAIKPTAPAVRSRREAVAM